MGKKLFVIGITFIILLLVIIAIPAFAILGEGLLVRWDIANPHVNQNFHSWHKVHVEDFHPFYIPEGWSLSKSNGIYWITDHHGEIWAFGTPLGKEEAVFSEYADLIKAARNLSFVDVECEPIHGSVLMDGSIISMLQIRDGISTDTCLCIRMFQTVETELVWVLAPEISKNEDQYDIAEAILYSFAF